MKRVIITGANGYIGSSLIKKLIDNMVEVVAIDCSFQNRKLPHSPLITEIESGLDCVDELKERIPSNEYDVFYHFAWAGVNGQMKSDPVIQLKNAIITMNCVKLATEMSCKKILCAGTIAERAVESLSQIEATSGGMIYGVTKYGTHMLFETYCKYLGIDSIWMQFSNIYGPQNKTGNLVSYTINELENGNNAEFGPACQPYDFIYVDDLIEAIIKLGQNKTQKRSYFIGSGTPRILSDYLYEIGEILGKKDQIKIGVKPDDGVRYSFGMFDTSNLVDEIGNYVNTSFSDGIVKTLSGYR